MKMTHPTKHTNYSSETITILKCKEHMICIWNEKEDIEFLAYERGGYDFPPHPVYRLVLPPPPTDY